MKVQVLYELYTIITTDYIEQRYPLAAYSAVFSVNATQGRNITL